MSRRRFPPARRGWRGAAAGATSCLLAACQIGAPSQALSLKSDRDPPELMVAVGRAAQECWFKSKDIAFSSYRLADETHAPAGRPRLLLVPRHDPAGLPRLVIQAEKKGDQASGTFTDVQTYGPALATPAGKRITDDVARWVSGSSACK